MFITRVIATNNIHSITHRDRISINDLGLMTRIIHLKFKQTLQKSIPLIVCWTLIFAGVIHIMDEMFFKGTPIHIQLIQAFLIAHVYFIFFYWY